MEELVAPKPFFLVFSGHFLFDWSGQGVRVLVPEMDGHKYRVVYGADGKEMADLAGISQMKGLGNSECLECPDQQRHMRHTPSVGIDYEATVLATISTFRKPSSVHVLTGRTVDAASFRNNMPAATIRSQPSDGRYTMADTVVWTYPAAEMPYLMQGAETYSAFDVLEGKAYGLLLLATTTKDTHHHHAGGTGAKKGANDVLRHGGKATTYRFAENISGEVLFENYAGFEWVGKKLKTPHLERGIPMGSCDNDSVGP